MHRIVLVVLNSPIFMGLRVLAVLGLVQVDTEDLPGLKSGCPSVAGPGKDKPWYRLWIVQFCDRGKQLQGLANRWGVEYAGAFAVSVGWNGSHAGYAGLRS